LHAIAGYYLHLQTSRTWTPLLEAGGDNVELKPTGIGIYLVLNWLGTESAVYGLLALDSL
jgi:hypothetical protein